MRRVAGLVWAQWFAGTGGGFFVGALASGNLGLDIDELSTIIEMVIAIPTLVAGAFALAWQIGTKVRLSAAIRFGLVAMCLASGLLIGRTLPSDEGTADDAAWLRTDVAKASLALLGASLATATVISVRRFPRVGPPERAPTLEEELYGPGA